MRIAVFISPHGFGHAARACALMQSLGCSAARGLEFEIFSTVPEWFLRQSLSVPFRLVRETVDVGLVQQGPLHEDMQATAVAVDELFDPSQRRVERLAMQLRRRRCDAVVADIAPLGLAAAAVAGVPSVLVENFTWDWIYSRHPDAPASLLRHLEPIRRINASATLHLQTVPVCAAADGAPRVGPMARLPRARRDDVRRRLGVGGDERLALLSLGGVAARLQLPEAVPEGWRLLVLGAADGRPSSRVEVLPPHGGHYHPDLAGAADVIVGKLGYSTVAEAWQAGCGLIWAPRPAFAETAVLAEHVRRVLSHAEIAGEDLARGSWTDALERLLPASAPHPFTDGAAEAAALILGMLGGRTR